MLTVDDRRDVPGSRARTRRATELQRVPRGPQGTYSRVLVLSNSFMVWKEKDESEMRVVGGGGRLAHQTPILHICKIDMAGEFQKS